VKHFYTELAV